MTLDETWDTIAGRLTHQQPLDLDPLLPDAPDQPDHGGSLGFRNAKKFPLPSPRIWPLEDEDQIHLGIRLVTPLEDSPAFAARLIAMASERGIYPIIFSALGTCGLEQFGLRVERLIGETVEQRHACEQDLKQFFHINIVMDADQVMTLG